MDRVPTQNIAAKVPPSLQAADELLTSYGRWAMNRLRQHRCGSAEGNYTPGAGEVQEAKREPREMLMHIDLAMDCQRALASVPEVERIVLRVLYVPIHRNMRLVPPQAQMRALGISSRLSQDRHIRGLRMFANLLEVLQRQKSQGTIRAPSQRAM